MNLDHYCIEHMTRKEFDLAISWAGKEGWNPGLNDGNCFYVADSNGFFSGKLKGKIIAVASAVIYDEQFAFCGFYMVNKKYRGQGYGLALTKARLAYVGQRNVGIDGVVNMLEKYERLGYKIAHYNARFEFCGAIKPSSSPYLIPAQTVDFELLSHYDRQHFPAYRNAFLQCWIHQPKTKSIVYYLDGAIKGFGVIRPCLRGFKIGPLFADTAEIAELIFNNLAQHINGQVLFLDIPMHHQDALALVQQYKMNRVFETARMYLKSEPQINLRQIYGITSFELG